jgi:predicted SprT family Zn-dependent metalloprotease
MQLDFFAKLIALAHPAKRPPRRARERQSPQNDHWQTLATTLFLELGCAELAARVTVRWNARMRSTAGTAFPTKALVNLNPRLREFGDDEIDRTLRHELAHLLAHHRAGRRRIAPHGQEWRKACVELGLSDETRCHNLPLPRRKLTARHRYRCPRCGIEIARVKPIRRKSACLACCRAHSRGSYDERFRFVRIL